MLEGHKEKEISKADMARKVEAYKAMYGVVVKTNAEFMALLNKDLVEKQTKHEELKNKIEKGEGTEEDNALCLYLGGYVACLQNILKVKKAQ